MNGPVKERLHPINPNPGKKSSAERTSSDVAQVKSATASIWIKISVSAVALALTVMLLPSLLIDVHFDYPECLTPAKTVAEKISTTVSALDESSVPKTKLKSTHYDFSSPVPECTPVSFDYFNDTVFIGDSRTKGLIMLSSISPTYDFSPTGLNVGSINEKAFIRMPDEETGELRDYTVFAALERERDNYTAIYIATGLNELGWPAEGYMQAFDKLVKGIREITDVPIYVQLIIPVTHHSSETTRYGITNEKCVEFNALIRVYAEKNKLFLLDPLDLFTLEDGTLSEDYTFDGAHLHRDACATLAEYYRTHVVNIYSYENTRPKESK